MPIYVETSIAASVDEVWRHSQDPALHQRWDLRFSTITYLPRTSEEVPQKFLYTTRLGFGFAISGEGESTGTRDTVDGSRTSALKFSSSHPASLIEKGSGYWKYLPDGDRTRFRTVYDYRPRFGLAGRMFDQTVFRPVMAWATAWSFDRLRLWMEEGISPESSAATAVAFSAAKLALSFLWIYQGLVPKLLFPDTGEIAILRGSGFFEGIETSVLRLTGVAEILFGLAHLSFWRSRIIAALNIPLLLALLILGAFSQRSILFAPFNAVTLTLAMSALAAISIILAKYTPSSANTRWSSQKAP